MGKSEVMIYGFDDLKRDCRNFCSIKEGEGIMSLIMTVEKKTRSCFLFL